jgi:hypothetical protein
MNRKTTLLGGALAAAVLLLPGVASATLILDTGTPPTTGTAGPALLNSSSWVAAEFSATAGEDITSVSAFLADGIDQAGSGATFTFDIYSNSNFINGRSTSRTLATPAITGTFTVDGWNTATLNWIPTVSGNYWLALQVSSSTQTDGVDLPLESSNSTGTAPALAFARLGSGTSNEYVLSGALPVGLEVTATPPVPLPPAVYLFGSGLLGLGLLRRRKPTENWGAAA